MKKEKCEGCAALAAQLKEARKDRDATLKSLSAIRKGMRRIAHAAEMLAGAKAGRYEERIMLGLRLAESVGMVDVTRNLCALVSGISPNSGHFNQAIADLAKRGWIEPPRKDSVTLSVKGKSMFPLPDEKLTREEYVRNIRRSLGDEACELAEMVAAQGSIGIRREMLCVNSKYAPSSHKFAQLMSKLRSLGLIEYGPNQTVKATAMLLMKELKA